MRWQKWPRWDPLHAQGYWPTTPQRWPLWGRIFHRWGSLRRFLCGLVEMPKLTDIWKTARRWNTRNPWKVCPERQFKSHPLSLLESTKMKPSCESNKSPIKVIHQFEYFSIVTPTNLSFSWYNGWSIKINGYLENSPRVKHMKSMEGLSRTTI